jgi:para-nitrobenzyl esterase
MVSEEAHVVVTIRRFAVALAMALALLTVLVSSASARGVVPTENGPVRGIDGATVDQYLGIPYAAPPVGALRWRPPQPAARWHGPRDTSELASHCPQTASPFGRESTTEDCLYLNVFTPDGKEGGKGRGHAKDLPVMVWLHGGGFVVGESGDYDPTRLVAQDVVVVTLNYRLGFLGFLSHPALSAESGAGSGNYGLMDQQAGLRWVQRNIKKFGGDPDDVTIFGESAGGASVHSHLASPLSAGLFDRAISQSGAYALSLPSLAQAENTGLGLAQTVGCDDGGAGASAPVAACLRAVPVAALLANQPTLPGQVGPIVDGVLLPRSIGESLSSGQFNRAPVVEGSTRDEFSIFTALNIEFVFGQLPRSEIIYGFVLSILVPTLGLDTTPEAVRTEYPLSAYPSVAEAVTAIATDAVFACSGREAARSLSQFVPTFAYEFADRDAPQVFVPPASFPYGAYHASELAYLFDSPLRGGHAPLTPAQEALAAAMVSYWTQFAHAGDPNGSGTPHWPRYEASTDRYMSLVPPAPVVETDFAAAHHCAFWDAL